MRQLHYSERNNNSLDLVLFLNGLPIFTAELKNPFTGQNVENAIKQYRADRDPREPLFAFGRCLAHFAVDPELVYMTSHLEGQNTIVLPFNKGKQRWRWQSSIMERLRYGLPVGEHLGQE